MNDPIEWLAWTGVVVTPWKIIGYVGALMFGARWLVQFVASRRAGRPVIPRLFWYMSVVGSFMTLYWLLRMLQDVGDTTTPLVRQMAQMSRWITVGVLAAAALLFVFGWWVRDLPPLQTFMAAVGLAVAVLP
jgi:lipid-A-disaccharide synthase-like uncharacterized protein